MCVGDVDDADKCVKEDWAKWCSTCVWLGTVGKGINGTNGEGVPCAMVFNAISNRRTQAAHKRCAMW